MDKELLKQFGILDILPPVNGKIRYRPHRGMLSDALEETIYIERKEELFNHIRKAWGIWEIEGKYIYIESIWIEYHGYDKRIDWDTWMVLAKCTDGQEYPVGWTDKELN